MRVRQACWGLKTITYHKSSQESKGGGQMTLWSFDRKDVFIIDQVLPSAYHPVLLLRLPTWVRISHSFEEAVTMSSLKIPKSLPVFPPFTWSETPIHMTFAKSATAIIPVLFAVFVWRKGAEFDLGWKSISYHENEMKVCLIRVWLYHPVASPTWTSHLYAILSEVSCGCYSLPTSNKISQC